MTKTLRVFLITFFLLQVFLISGFELAHDEAYYWLYSQNLDWGFFDHPPLVGFIIWLFSFLPHSEFAVRIGFLVLQLGSLLLLINLTGVPWLTTLLFFSFPLASFAGLFALPDTPLLFMTALYCLMLKKYLKQDNIINSALLGLVIALLFYAKYHGVLVVFFTIIALPNLLKRKSFYQTALVALVCFLPHLIWQYQNEFSTLRYHFIERPSSSFSLSRTIEYIFLQVFLAGLFAAPVVWWLAIKSRSHSPFMKAMKSISFGTVLFFLISSFGKKIEANWTIFLAIPLIILSVPIYEWNNKKKKTLLNVSFAFVLLTRIILIFPPEVISLKRLREFHGWRKWSEEVRLLCEDRTILANSYQVASKLSFYLNTSVTALNYESRKNQFDIWRFDKKIQNENVCYITDKTDFVGIPLEGPDRKTLLIVKNQSLKALQGLKYK